MGVVVDNDLRAEAYGRLLEEFPGASRLLSASAAAFWCGHDTAGQVKYAALQTEAGLQVAPYIYMGDFEAGSTMDLAAAMRRCVHDGAVFPIAEGTDEADDISLPDLRPWTFTVQIPDRAETLTSVPHS
ncbi:MAG TPA: hypothetical protein PLV68_10025 [Ilumatobacteraceae bacterium]|nr:hypothetical protein [Ilumatobacteraceae bacterium]